MHWLCVLHVKLDIVIQSYFIDDFHLLHLLFLILCRFTHYHICFHLSTVVLQMNEMFVKPMINFFLDYRSICNAKKKLSLNFFYFQNAGNAWPGTQQVLVGSWQQIPGIPTQRAVQQPLLTDTLAASQALQDSWRQSLVLDNLEQSSLASLVRWCIPHSFVFCINLFYIVSNLHKLFPL